MHSGQHYDHLLSSSFFDEFSLPKPDFQMEIGGKMHNEQLGHFLMEIDAFYKAFKPDIVFVYGDTNTTAAAAISAAKNNIPVAHIEAGLREFNKQVPEEINKLITDSVSDLFFVPTASGVHNLKNAGIVEGVHLVGDVMLDHLRNSANRIPTLKEMQDKLDFNFESYYYLTCHRAVNTEHAERLRSIIQAVIKLDFPVLFPAHPRTIKAINKYNFSALFSGSKVKLIKPVSFWDNQSLILHAKHIITDSGGVIKEAYFHKIPCSIIDDQSEWTEVIKEGWAEICGSNPHKIISSVQDFTIPQDYYHVFGKSNASSRICQLTYEFLANR